MEAQVYNQKGEKVSEVELPPRLFSLPWNGDLVHQVVTSMRATRRRNTAETKDRKEVRGGGRKPWRQKGTGRARHGSIRSPLWRGGGVTHGPTTERNYFKKINKKMKAKAFFTVLSRKWREGEVIFIDDFSFTKPKTKEAQIVLNHLSRLPKFNKLNFKKGNRALIALPEAQEALVRSLRNIKSVAVRETRNLNPLDLLNYQYLMLVRPPDNLAVLSRRLG